MKLIRNKYTFKTIGLSFIKVSFTFIILISLVIRAAFAQSHDGHINTAGWYRIAQNGTTLGGSTGTRAAAHFILTDKTSSLHQTVEFLAYINFNKMPSITVLNNSYYGTLAVPFPKIRILSPDGVYGGSAIDVYVNNNGTNNDSYYLEDNDQASGWTAVEWTSVTITDGDNDGVPAGFTARVLDLRNLVNGFVTKTAEQRSFHNGNFYTSGNILLGKTSQTNTAYKLDVNGKIRSNEVVVNTTGADFVFDSTYLLPSLSSVKDYIRIKHHLPNIPSAEEMQTNGLSLGENQTILLQKIEELTLYLLAQQQEVKELKTDVEALKSEIKALKNMNITLEKRKQRKLKLKSKQDLESRPSSHKRKK